MLKQTWAVEATTHCRFPLATHVVVSTLQQYTTVHICAGGRVDSKAVAVGRQTPKTNEARIARAAYRKAAVAFGRAVVKFAVRQKDARLADPDALRLWNTNDLATVF